MIDRLFEQPHSFEFFQAVRLLEAWFVRHEGLAPNDVMAQRLSFRNSLSMSFPASEIERFETLWRDQPDLPDRQRTTLDTIAAATQAVPRRLEPGQVNRLEITPAFMSLLGAGGTLPIFYTELFARREQLQRDSSARAFLDIFLHRSVVLFYQAWRKHRLAIRYESDRRNQFLPQVLSLAGMGQKSLRNRLGPDQGGVSDEMIAFLSGLFQQRSVSASALQQVLSLYFRVPVKVTQFVGRWFKLPIEHQTRLGLGNAQLGSTALSGERVWQRDLRVGLTIGPLSLERYRRFLPGGSAALALKQLVTQLTGVSLEYEVRLQLKAAEVRPVRLGGEQGPRLGWETYLVSGPVAQDRSDAGYDLHAAH
ncbi:type VI secretion system baseplate subunit TssG [Hydrogenophaga sp.]|uniref:type VI secretion system baseplate subunit TssG n=1 Tax=Hydrogenophaga sp. TaxID=1904254 RepID=UPI00391C705F